MANEFDIDALLDQALGNIHSDSNKDSSSNGLQSSSESVASQEIGSQVVNSGFDSANDQELNGSTTISATGNGHAPTNSQDIFHPQQDRASAKSKLQELRAEIANASKTFNLDDALNASFSPADTSVNSNGNSLAFEDIVNSYNQPKSSTPAPTFPSLDENTVSDINSNTAADNLQVVSAYSAGLDAETAGIESALDNVLGTSESGVLNADDQVTYADPTPMVSADADIDKLLAAEFDEDVTVSPKAKTPPPPPVQTHPVPPTPVVVPPQVVPEVVAPSRQIKMEPSIPKYVAEEGVLATPPPKVGVSASSNSSSVEDLLNGILDEASTGTANTDTISGSGPNKQQLKRDAVMNEFQNMASAAKQPSPPPPPVVSSTKKTYAFPKKNVSEPETSDSMNTSANQSVDEPYIGMQPIISKKGTVRKLGKK